MQKLNPKKIKKILLITSTFPRGDDDMLANWIGKFCLELKKEGLIVEVFAPSYRGRKQKDYHGIPVYRFRYAPSFLEFLTQDEGAVLKLRKYPWLFPVVFLYMLFGSISLVLLTTRKSYDIIHIHWPIPQGFFGLIAKLLTKSKMVMTFYGAEFALVKRVPFLKYFLYFFISQADSVTAISNFTSRKIQEIKKISTVIIPFSSPIESVRHKVPIGKTKENNILFVGRLVDRKGVEFIISAMPLILKKVHAQLTIVGEGPLSNFLQRKISELGLNNYVTMKGEVSRRELVTLYARCSVFVLPAIVDKWGETEGLGVVLLEAMSFKKPVVASNVGGISDIVEDGKNGFLVPQKDSKAIASSILKILQDANLAKSMGNNGYRLLLAKFSWKSIIDKTLNLYSGLGIT